MCCPDQIGGYKFKNVDLLKAAFTHSSYAHEQHEQSYERLEFLGDSILGFICAEYLFKNYPDLPEGELTKIRAAVVCEKSLFLTAREYGFEKYLRLGHGERSSGGVKKSILADTVEAVLAAVYIDGGIECAREFALSFLPEKIDRAIKEHECTDYKTTLQEIVQKNRQETLAYKLKGESGPDHDKTFFVDLYLNNNKISTGEGKSKKQAEQNAAKSALNLMGEL